jgi:hypothetical protein
MLNADGECARGILARLKAALRNRRILMIWATVVIRVGVKSGLKGC